MASEKPELFQPRRPWLLDPNEADSSNGQVFATANIAVETYRLDRDKNT